MYARAFFVEIITHAMLSLLQFWANMEDASLVPALSAIYYIETIPLDNPISNGLTFWTMYAASEHWITDLTRPFNIMYPKEKIVGRISIFMEGITLIVSAQVTLDLVTYVIMHKDIMEGLLYYGVYLCAMAILGNCKSLFHLMKSIFKNK